MASAIDPTLPVQGNPTTASVRANFSAAKSEIEALQATAGVGPQGPVGPTGPSGTLTVGTVTTGPAGGSASVTNSGTTQAAVLNFTLPRGDSGTGGSGITETQAIDAVRHGNPNFLESPETTAVTFPTTPNAAGAPVVGANWTPATGGTATQAYTHDIGSTEPLAYPASISSGTFYQVVFGLTNVPATSTVLAGFVSIYFRTAPTSSTGQQTLMTASAGATVTIQATGNFTHVVVVPVSSGWQGTFTMTRVVAFTGAQNSVSLSVKDWPIRVRDSSAYIGGGGRLATSTDNVSFGLNALASLTSASNNVAVGSNALSRISSNGSNTAIGANALQFNVSSGNTAVGQTCMANVLTSNNVAVGSTTLQSNSSGGSNTAVGYGSMQSSSTALRNCAIGLYALYGPSGVSGSPPIYNTALGEWALGQNMGSYNTAVGSRALSPTVEGPTLVTGSYVTALGYKAGAHTPSGGNLTTVENSVFLGANSKGHANGETNQIVIGYNAEGHGSHTITLGNGDITALHCQVQTISALSDSRVKENIQAADLQKCVDAVKNLPLSQWDWLPIAGAHLDKHAVGFMADDVAKVWPKAVTKEDTSLTVRNADGKPEMTTATEVGTEWKPTPDAPMTPATVQTRQIEKTQEFKDLCYVSTADMLPALWGAVQRLIQRIEELEKPADNPAGASGNPSAESKGGFFRGKKQ